VESSAGKIKVIQVVLSELEEISLSKERFGGHFELLYKLTRGEGN